MIENHMVLAEDRRNQQDVLKLEERLEFLRAKIDSLSKVADTVFDFIPSAAEFGLDEKHIVDFHSYINGEIVATITEEEITRDDYFKKVAIP